jgi:hypothetical protein
MRKLCTECNFIGQEQYNEAKLQTIIIIMFGGVLFIVTLFFNPSYISAIIALAFFLYGTYSFILFLKDPYICPACDKKKTMIPFDSLEAQEIIKENNLTFWEESPEQSTSPSQTP